MEVRHQHRLPDTSGGQARAVLRIAPPMLMNAGRCPMHRLPPNVCHGNVAQSRSCTNPDVPSKAECPGGELQSIPIVTP